MFLNSNYSLHEVVNNEEKEKKENQESKSSDGPPFPKLRLLFTD